MKKLLSLPSNLIRKNEKGTTVFHDITGRSADEYFCTSDPVGHRVGSGGGTAWLLMEAFRHETGRQPSEHADLCDWLSREKRILLHAGGQSRRLPAYAPSGKLLTPVPVLRWERGQRLSQDLLELQLPLYERIMEKAPESLHTMVVSGDVYIRTTQQLPQVPTADVVCYGIWLDASVATHHGVFVSDRRSPQVLKQMLQKPSVGQLQALQHNHLYLTDIGLWLLSDRAVSLLMKRCVEADETEAKPNRQSTIENSNSVNTNSVNSKSVNSKYVNCNSVNSKSVNSNSVNCKYYDLYAEFGCALGSEPEFDDPELRSLSVAIVPLSGGEFYHFGTSREMISSTLALQNVVADQRQIMHHDRKPHPSIFVQNAITDIHFTPQNRNVWIENSHVGPHWTLTSDNIVTGVPRNDWDVHLEPGQCIDIVPIGEDGYAVRRYHIDDRFDGPEQQRPRFPVGTLAEIPELLASPEAAAGRALLSAEQLSDQANLQRLFAQREQFRCSNWPLLAANWEHSVFYQLDLDFAAAEYARNHIEMPAPLPDDAPLAVRMHDAMFRGDSQTAFGLLRKGLTEPMLARKQQPRLAVCRDQIVWARSPVRIDIAGGWTDTPPFCLLEGGNVVNLAIDLNGQQPLQAYIRPSAEYTVTLRSIDLGAAEVVTTFNELRQFNRVGSPFSIPKAALALAGFLPEFAENRYASLEEQLRDFGCGIELTLLSAIPAGSGLGTSSILAATVLGAVSDFCALAWDKNDIGMRTLVLEQLLTTGGGWQDQFGGICGGVKLLQTNPGFHQAPLVRWLPTDVFTLPDYRQCHLLYYTGITRTAKQILAEIVRRMFLNNHDQLLLLRQMKQHALDMYEAIQRQDFRLMGQFLRTNWGQNKMLDSGTNPEAVARLTDLIDDLCLGYKLPGAGGGGYLYMIAKDPEAAARIRSKLTQHRINANARFVDMSLSNTGLQISRS